ncbi:MAG: peptidase M41, partial [Rikenellaceae bacterium]
DMSYFDSSGQSDMGFTKPYSEKTAQLIDTEAKEMLSKAYAMATQVLTEHKAGLVELAELLLEREVVFTEDVEKIFGKRKKDIAKEAAEAAKAAKTVEAATQEGEADHAEEVRATTTDSDSATESKKNESNEDSNTTIN